jgi:hypothetical protein
MPRFIRQSNAPIVPSTMVAEPELNAMETKAYEIMNAPLRAKVMQIRHHMDDERRQLLESRYQLGELSLEIQNHPRQYGYLAEFAFGAFFGVRQALCSEARRIRERYAPKRFQQIIEARNPHTGAQIHYKHLALLLFVKDDAEADQLLEQCLAGSWTLPVLTKHIKTAMKKGQGSNGFSRLVNLRKRVKQTASRAMKQHGTKKRNRT